MNLTKQEQEIFQETLRTGNLDIFTEFFFQLPMSGTWYTTEDRPEAYTALHEAWLEVGSPDTEFSVTIEGSEIQFRVAWDRYYGSYPMFLLPHGFRGLPWVKRLLSPDINIGVAVTGAGTGKTTEVAIAALTYCALYPGFRFLNVAPTATQADLMLGEVDKWASNTQFAKLIKRTRGVNPLWVQRTGLTTIAVEVHEGYPSTFVCQTIGRQGKGILGGERDWINVDETQLVDDLERVREIFATRLRGTRSTGIPRWSKQTYITNPGRNPELISMMEQLDEAVKNGSENILVLRTVDSSENIYLTKRQLDNQRKSLVSGRSIDRWIGGDLAAVFADGELSEDLLELCRSKNMDAFVDEFGVFDDVVGLVQYEMEWDPSKSYIVIGDVGKSSRITLSSQNVPCVMVFEMPNDFLDKPCRMVAFYWFDGGGSYKTFLNVTKRAMLKYRSQLYYDATNVQTAMEDFDDAYGKLPTTPIFFSGGVGPKRWAISVLIMMMSDKLFEWPYIKAFWHQARIFDPSNRKNASDIIATLLVMLLAFRVEATLLDKLVERYGWDPDEEEDIYVEEKDQFSATYIPHDRYSRIMG